MDSKEKNSDVGSTVEKRTDEIEDTIREETGKSPVVGDSVVEMAIKRVAGHSEPTLNQYKDLLRERDSLYPHPKQSDKYVREKQEFVVITQQMRQNEVISQNRYQELVKHIGLDQFKETYNDWKDEPERGVQ